MFHVRDRHHDARMGLRTAPESTDSALRKRSRASASIRRYVSHKYESYNHSPPRQVCPLSSLEACHSVVSSPGLRPQYGKLTRCLTMRPHEFSDRSVIQAQDGAVRAPCGLHPQWAVRVTREKCERRRADIEHGGMA